MIDEEEFRGVMRTLAAAITIVTTSHEERYFGLTVTAFCSVSLTPPLVQVSLDVNSRTHEAIVRSGFFCANILAEGQADLARTFTQKDVDRFESISVEEGITGAPRIVGALASLDCRVMEKVSAGDHTIFLGEALEGHFTQRKPLVYFNSGYYGLMHIDTK